ncbi:MAG TPA: transcription factor jumonji JmjC domain-containing protein [Planctomycetota bacterium]|nr:transcription factor jumonji JmjC domain-containing protein [Planctomycetota bacterium]
MNTLGKFIDPSRAARLGRDARSQEHWLGLGREGFACDYDREPFLVEHKLEAHPLLQRDELFDLCRRLPRDSIGLRYGQVPVEEDLGNAFRRYGLGIDLEDALKHFEERGAYIVINNPERDSRYREPIERLLGEIAESTEQLDPGITWYSTYVFITSREALTPYHMDRELNFLFQVCGTKQVKLWDPADDEVMSPAQKDELLAYGSQLRPPYKASFESKARVFELRPGLGVHHPFIAPHVVRTESTFSISLALTYRTRRTDILTAAHRLNHALRKRGWTPRSVGIHPTLDRTKATLTRVLRGSRAAARALGHLGGR